MNQMRSALRCVKLSDRSWVRVLLLSNPDKEQKLASNVWENQRCTSRLSQLTAISEPESSLVQFGFNINLYDKSEKQSCLSFKWTNEFVGLVLTCVPVLFSGHSVYHIVSSIHLDFSPEDKQMMSHDYIK